MAVARQNVTLDAIKAHTERARAAETLASLHSELFHVTHNSFRVPATVLVSLRGNHDRIFVSYSCQLYESMVVCLMNRFDPFAVLIRRARRSSNLLIDLVL